MSHTPGPWQLEGQSIYALQQDGWRKGEPVMVNRFYAQVQTGRANGELTPYVELIANARLIAASPDLLAALQILHPRKDVWVTPTDEQAAQIESAINKALGA